MNHLKAQVTDKVNDLKENAQGAVNQAKEQAADAANQAKDLGQQAQAAITPRCGWESNPSWDY